MDAETVSEADALVRANAHRWHVLALIWGYNELAKMASTLGEKIYCRLARDIAEEEYRQLGGNIEHTEDAKAVLVLRERMPYLRFEERDIELMRMAVRDHDARKAQAHP